MLENQDQMTQDLKNRSVANLARGKKVFRIFILVALVVVLVTLAVLFLRRGFITTDNAMLQADIIPIAARVSGQIESVFASDNQHVHKGDTLVVINSSDFTARLSQSEGDLQVAQAQLQSAVAQKNALTASSQNGVSGYKALQETDSSGKGNAEGLTSTQAAVARVEAQKNNAELELGRMRNLYDSGSVSRAQLDNAQTAYDMARASLEQAMAALGADHEQRNSAEAQITLATARVKSATAALELARNQLSYTVITAAADGMVSKLSVHPGQLVVSGQTLAQLVPARCYVTANFKEIQIRKVHPGDKVNIKVDAYPDRQFRGVVESISGGTGSVFSLLPPDNASGNYIKVVQRIPVRIRLLDDGKDQPMQAGLSAKVTVLSDQKYSGK